MLNHERQRYIALFQENLEIYYPLRDEFDQCGIEEEYYFPIIEFIIKDGFDITGFHIDDIPLENTQFCFVNKKAKQCFDINLEYTPIHSEITVEYMDSKHQMYAANSIKEAVSKYFWE